MQRFIIASVLSGLCGFTAVYVSAGLRFNHHDESVYRELALWEGKPFLYDGQAVYHPEHQNRVMFPAALVAVSRIGLFSTSEWYLILRLFIAYLAFLTFFYAVNVNYNLAAVGMAVLLLTLLFAFNHVMEHAADFLDVLFMSLFLWAALKKHYGWMIAFTVAACFNRESAVFAGVLWICV